ncbi:hypothetical protein [Streptococcus ruminantium]|uniref:hypothetical protein n=1 Tax=Streptococcus ruminantium TaxID=1917441 RepID=UPI00280CD255|nr:hypothetical protein [Streptococcus ruminantium]MDQ8836474.1 hypothetical protein [Streptococcus ruminantium]
MRTTTTKNKKHKGLFKKQLRLSLVSAILAGGVIAGFGQYSTVFAEQGSHGSSVYGKLNQRSNEKLTDDEIYERARNRYLSSQNRLDSGKASTENAQSHGSSVYGKLNQRSNEKLTDDEIYERARNRYLSSQNRLDFGKASTENTQSHGSSVYGKLNQRSNEKLTDDEIYERARVQNKKMLNVN